jgi:proteic killer suppression protein
MIASIRHKGLLRFFSQGDHSGIPAHLAPRIARLLDRLDICRDAADMNVPGLRFHALKGDRAGTYAVTASANWRITFRFDGRNAVDVDLEDYH